MEIYSKVESQPTLKVSVGVGFQVILILRVNSNADLKDYSC